MLHRRELIRGVGLLPFAGIGPGPHIQEDFTSNHLKLSLNAYSFDRPLKEGSFDLIKLLDFCATNNFDAADLTGYYFPGYPQVPPDDFIYALKKKAHTLGLAISGTGVRNDFTHPDKAKRTADINHVRAWIEVASKLGAPVIRIFSGVQNPAGFGRDDIEKWMVEDIKVCVDHGRRHGVIVAIQNHNDFIKTGAEAISVIKQVDSEWFGLVLDIGSYQSGDPYTQIAETAKYAVNWQIKENMTVNGTVQKTDLSRVFSIIKASAYRGYLPIETLDPGDPLKNVPVFLRAVRAALYE